MLLAVACTRAPPPSRVEARQAGAGFLAAPSLLRAERSPEGGVRLFGAAPADATVRLASPDGRAVGVTADASGRWSVELPPAAAPRLFALSAESGGRTVRGEGALVVLPPGAAAVAAVARAGAPAMVAASPAGAGLRLEAIDFDGGGGLAAAGSAPAGVALRLMADGEAAGVGRADAAGRFGLLAVARPLAAGAHRVRVEAATQAAEAQVETGASAPLAAPYRAARAPGGWRIDWATPGGGVQSLFAPDGAAVAR